MRVHPVSVVTLQGSIHAVEEEAAFGELDRAREITERPRAPNGVAASMSAHSQTPYITPSMGFTSGKRVVWGRRGQQLRFTLTVPARIRPEKNKIIIK